MTRQAALAVAVIFVLAVAVGALVGGATTDVVAPPGSDSTLPTSTTEPKAVFVSSNETVIGPVVLVAAEPRVVGSQLVIDFDVQGLAPIADAASVTKYAGFGSTQVVPPTELENVYLDSWVLHAGGTTVEGSVANPAARAARFEVGDTFDPRDIEGITVSSYALLSPIDTTIVLDSGAETATVAPGVTARLLAITEQDNTIIQVELVSDRRFNLDTIGVSGAGPGWLAAVRESEGRPRWNLTYDSTTAPSPITLVVSGSVWLTIEGTIPVAIEGLP